MISWMQKNNRYLVITIWIATIAFIGAGFVGWGSVNFGIKASSVAKVGDIAISKTKYSFNYNNLYSQYAQKFGNKFDKKMAKNLGLDKVVYENLVTQALLLNMAKEYGIIVTNKEIGEEIISYSAFQDSNGTFSKSIYNNFLRARSFKASDYENILKDDLIIRKLFKFVNIKPLDFEKEIMRSILKIADKIKYRVLNKKDINVTINEESSKKYWENNKINYLTKKSYSLDLLWTNTNDINVTNDEIETFYKKNSFNYLDNSGKIKDIKDIKDIVTKDIKLEKAKKQAAIERSRFKKGKIKATQSVVLNIDNNLSVDAWKAIKTSKIGDYTKPKIVGNRYVTIYIKNIKESKEMTYEQAKKLVLKDYKSNMQDKKLNKLADSMLKDSSVFNLESKNYITLSKPEILKELTPQDSFKVIRAIFASSDKTNKINISSGIVVYTIIDQKIVDNNTTNNNSLDGEFKDIKNKELANNLLNELAKKYKIESYIKGF